MRTPVRLLPLQRVVAPVHERVAPPRRLDVLLGRLLRQVPLHVAVHLPHVRAVAAPAGPPPRAGPAPGAAARGRAPSSCARSRRRRGRPSWRAAAPRCGGPTRAPSTPPTPRSSAPPTATRRCPATAAAPRRSC